MTTLSGARLCSLHLRRDCQLCPPSIDGPEGTVVAAPLSEAPPVPVSPELKTAPPGDTRPVAPPPKAYRFCDKHFKPNCPECEPQISPAPAVGPAQVDSAVPTQVDSASATVAVSSRAKAIEKASRDLVQAEDELAILVKSEVDLRAELKQLAERRADVERKKRFAQDHLQKILVGGREIE